MAELTFAEQDELFNNYDQLSNSEKIELLGAMVEPYWSPNVPRERMDRMRTNVILAIIIGLNDKFETRDVSDWMSFARYYLPPFNSEDVAAVLKFIEAKPTYAITALQALHMGHWANPQKYNVDKKRYPLPKNLRIETLLESDNAKLRSIVYEYLEDMPGWGYFYEALVKFKKENKMTSEEEARFKLIEPEVERLRMEHEEKMLANPIPEEITDRSPVTEERKQFIFDIANGEWVDRLPKDTSDEEFEKMLKKMNRERNKFLKNCISPEELHLFAEAYNWDNGVGSMQSVIESRVCDRNTALLVFWRGSPTFYQQYDYGDIQNRSPSEREGWQLVRRIRNGIYAGGINRGRLMPRLMPETYKNETSEQTKDAKWDIHDLMYGR